MTLLQKMMDWFTWSREKSVFRLRAPAAGVDLTTHRHSGHAGLAAGPVRSCGTSLDGLGRSPVHFLALLNEGVELSDPFEGELVHEVDDVGLAEELVLEGLDCDAEGGGGRYFLETFKNRRRREEARIAAGARSATAGG